jgi:DNA polymerase III delta subunit
MIYIIHGDNVSASRNNILTLQKKHSATSKKEIHIKDTTPEQVSDLFSNLNIFGDITFVVLDVSGSLKTDFEPYIKVFKKIPEDSVLVIFNSSTLTQSNVLIAASKDLKATVLTNTQFKNSNVFRFCDLVFSGNRKGSYREYRNLVISGEDPFYIFSMLLYNLRNLGIDKFKSDLFSKLSPTAKSKARDLSSKYTDESILNLYSYFYSVDRDIKIGNILPEMMIPLVIEKVISYSV